MTMLRLPSTTLECHLQEGPESAWQLCKHNMARLCWVSSLLALTAFSAFTLLATAQSSTSAPADGLTTAAASKTISYATATIDGTPTRYSVAFTVPAEADIGPNLLPNVVDPHAKQAQALCPGYKASHVKRTANGFSASLSLAGNPVRI